jgi:hypothetical protein
VLTLDEPLAFENVTGSAFDDVILGDVIPHTLRGRDGDGKLIGREDNDTIHAGVARI